MLDRLQPRSFEGDVYRDEWVERFEPILYGFALVVALASALSFAARASGCLAQASWQRSLRRLVSSVLHSFALTWSLARRCSFWWVCFAPGASGLVTYGGQWRRTVR